MADFIQLTPAEKNQSNYVPFSTPVSSSSGISITFDFYAYGGQEVNDITGAVDNTLGGDGLSFFFFNGNQLPSLSGGSGGSLGYAPRDNTPGLSGGYVALGIDAYGNFSNPIEGRVGGPGQTKDSISVRGSEATGYQYLAGTGTLPISVDNPGPAATLENSKRTAKIDLDQAGNLSVSIDQNNNGAIESNEEVIRLNVIDSGNGPLPSTFRFGFAASTGSATNNHVIGNFQVTTLTGAPIVGNFSNNPVIIGEGGDGSSGKDSLIGTDSSNQIVSVGSNRQDTLVGKGGGDRFVFSGKTKKQALKTSTLNRTDRVQDFSFAQGDRFQLDFDNNLATITPIEFPKRVFNAGKLTGSLKRAAEQAYADRDFKKQGNQALKANEAVFFRLGKRTYLSVNDNQSSFSASSDLFVNVTGIQFKAGDLNKSSLARGSYFAVNPLV